MTSKTFVSACAGLCVAASACTALGQVPMLLNGNVETADPFVGGKAQGFRKYNYTQWIQNAPVKRSGLNAVRFQGSEGRPNGEYGGYETEDPLDPNAFEIEFNWPEFTFNPPSGQPLNASFWFNIALADALVVSQFGMKVEILRNAPGNFSSFQTFEYLDVDPNNAMVQYPGTFLTTRTGPFGVNGETITLPAVHTNGLWIKFTKTINQSQICIDGVNMGICPDPPTNPAYIKFQALRFDFPDNLPCGNFALGEPPCVRKKSYGIIWVDDFAFSQGTVCLADFNGSGNDTVQDLFDFLGAWFAKCGNNGALPPSTAPCFGRTADVNGSGLVTVQDLFDFLAAWFAGCPN